MGTSTNDLRINIAVEEREARRRMEAFNRAQDNTARTAVKANQQIASSGQARNQVTKEAEAVTKRLERSIAAVERRSVTFGLRGVEKIRAQRDEMLRLARATGQTEQQLNRITNAYKRMEDQAARSQRRQGGLGAAGLARGAVGAAAALGVVISGREVAAFVGESIQASARAEQLGITLDVLAERFNVSRLAMSETERTLRGLRLTTEQSRDAIQLFTKAGASQEEVVKLVGVAYDAAARRGLTLDDSLRRLADATAKAEPELLDELGIVIKLTEVYRNYARQLGITDANQLSTTQRSRALVEALVAGADNGGEFAATIGTTARALQDASQETNIFKERLGSIFSEKSRGLVDLYTESLRRLNDQLGNSKEREEAIQAVQDRRLSKATPEQLRRLATLGGAVRPGADDPRVIEALMQRIADDTLAARLDPRLLKGVGGVAGAPAPDAAGGGEADVKRAVERAKSILESAQLSELEGLDKIIRQRQIYLTELGKTEEAVRAIQQATDIQLRQEGRRLDEQIQREQEAFEKRSPIGASLAPGEDEGLTAFARVQQQRLETSERTGRELLDQERRRLDERHELELLKLESLGTDTVAQKVALEDRKLQIEIEYLRRSSALTEAKIQQDIAKEIAANRGAAEELYSLQARLFEESFLAREAAIAQAQQRTANTQAQLIADSNQRIFDDLQRQAEGVFDALFIRTGSFFSRLSGFFQQLTLTGIKNVFSNTVAGALAGGGGGAGGSGGLGGLGALFGGGIGLGGFGRAGAPGGTVGFAGPVGSLASRTGGSGALAGLGVPANLAALKGLFGIGAATPTFLPGGALATQGTSLGSVLGSKGAGLAGLAIAALSIKKGGLTGILGGAGGGALAGFSFGGPVGAAIGAAIGGVAGAIRTLFKSATDKARQKVKQFYGVEIRDKTTLEQIVGIAKQGYGGNLDMAIASPQVRDLVELYSMAHGQGARGFGIDIVTARLVQQRGQLYQEPTYRYGTPVLAPSRIPVTGVGANEQVINVSFQMDGRSVNEAFAGQTTQYLSRNPRTVQNSVQQAQRQNYDRRGSAARTLEPGTVLA